MSVHDRVHQFIVGVAVVLVAGYLIASHRDRIRGLANATMLGISAGAALSDSSESDDHTVRHDDGAHPSESHWDGIDSTPDADSI